jgi:hypothetical protein
LFASTRQLVLTNSQMIKTWVADWPLHSNFTSSIWWSKMKTTSICPSSRYDDNSFIPWSRCSTTRQCRLFSDSDWCFESILKSSLHLLSHGLDHSLGFTIKTFAKSSIVDGVDSRHVLPLMTNLSSDKL